MVSTRLVEFPKPLTEDIAKTADVIVTMGCGDTCPLYPGKRYLDWDLQDPTGMSDRRGRDRSSMRSIAESRCCLRN